MWGWLAAAAINHVLTPSKGALSSLIPQHSSHNSWSRHTQTYVDTQSSQMYCLHNSPWLNICPFFLEYVSDHNSILVGFHMCHPHAFLSVFLCVSEYMGTAMKRGVLLSVQSSMMMMMMRTMRLEAQPELTNWTFACCSPQMSRGEGRIDTLCLGQEMDLIHSCDLMTPSSQFMPVVSAVCVGCVFVRSDRDRKSAALLSVFVSVCELHVYCSFYY